MRLGSACSSLLLCAGAIVPRDLLGWGECLFRVRGPKAVIGLDGIWRVERFVVQHDVWLS
jgi:hypothetical protein